MGKWTRRGFITAGVVGGTALVVGVALRPGNRNPELAKLVVGEGESLVNTFVKIDADNKVTAIVPHSEMGQGAQTALTQMLADELDANWEDVSFEEAPAADEYANWALVKGYALGGAKVPSVLTGTADGAFMQVARAMHMQVTGGSLSVRSTGVTGMRVAGAAAREMLIETAAGSWGVDIATITTERGVLYHRASNRQALYAHFAAAAGERTPPRSPALKSPDQFKLMGESKPRLDIPPKVDGSARFGIDVALDGMKTATIAAAPVFGARVASVDDSEALAMPGVMAVVDLGDAVAIVAEGYWQAKKALDKVEIQWTEIGDEVVDSKAIFDQFQQDLETGEPAGSDVSLGDAASALQGADRVIRREYRVPYLAHACMEPMNAVARVADGRCELWTGTQDPLRLRHALVDALGIEYENVSVTNHFMGGGFGRRAKPDTAIQAARISRDVGVPVKLIWSREEDIRHDHYRPAVASNFRAALGADGMPVAWENRFVEKHEPAEASHIPYGIPNQDIGYVDSQTHIPFGAWRSVDHSQHGFFVESFIDELAVEAGQDPYQYRRKLLAGSPRHRTVLDKAAEMAAWESPMGKNRGRGIALQESFGTIVAEVVEVTFDSGELSVDRVVVAVDPGFAVSPDGLTAQMESGVVFGLTAALYGEISIEEGRVRQGNFHDYPMLRMNAAPAIETHIINSMERWGGAGEPGTPAIAPALVNAIFAATGNRIRELPVSKFDFNYRLPPEIDV
jgi:isoquinoline 1-oxidoreductase beta subunit